MPLMAVDNNDICKRPKKTDQEKKTVLSKAVLRNGTTESKEEGNPVTPAKRGRKVKAQSWGRDRTRSESNIIELIRYEKRKEREPSGLTLEKENPGKKEAKEPEKKNKENTEKMDQWEEKTDRDLILEILKQMKEDKKEIKEEIDLIRKEMREEIEKKWKKETEEIEEKINRKIDETTRRTHIAMNQRIAELK